MENPFRNIVVVFWPETADPIPVRFQLDDGKLMLAVHAEAGSVDESAGLALLDALQGALADQLVEAEVAVRRHPKGSPHRPLPDAVTLELRPRWLRDAPLAAGSERIQ
jgi:hypothetical protein